jgi:catechol 2,3-dioxygenase-like lactoylglutathione lyase family enzyme
VTPEDFDATADFYGDALGLKCAWRSAEAGIATYEIGFGPTIVVERAEPAPGRDARFGRFTGICLEVADIASAYLSLQARGVEFESPPVRQYWGGVMAFFSDPAGNNHTLLQQPTSG